MRYHWGKGIGHRYAFASMATSESNSTIHEEAEEAENDQYPDLELDEDSEGASDTGESNNSELGLGDRDPEGWEDVETSDSGSDLDSQSERDSEFDED